MLSKEGFRFLLQYELFEYEFILHIVSYESFLKILELKCVHILQIEEKIEYFGIFYFSLFYHLRLRRRCSIIGLPFLGK